MELSILIITICFYCCFRDYLISKHNKSTIERNFIDDMTNKGFEQSVKDNKIIWVKINGSSKIS